MQESIEFEKMKSLFLYIALISLCICSALADQSILDDFKPKYGSLYLVRLTNGDLLSGYLTEMSIDADSVTFIKIKTLIGTATVYDYQISDIILKEDEYKHSHRVYLLPTAEPIKSNHFLGNYELVFFYLGFGISDFFSFTAGRSVIPNIPSYQQLSVANAKFTVYQDSFDSLAKGIYLAVGGNLAWLNHNNQLAHLYGVSTIDFGRTKLSANLFYKIGAQDYYILNFWNYSQPLIYTNGAFGLGLGLDSKLPQRNDIHIIAELWNNDIAKPTHTTILMGLRICNTTFSADFGLSFFAQPFIAPFVSFIWTPF